MPLSREAVQELIRMKVLEAIDEAFNELEFEGTVIDNDLPELFPTLDRIIELVVERESTITLTDTDDDDTDGRYMTTEELEEEFSDDGG